MNRYSNWPTDNTMTLCYYLSLSKSVADIFFMKVLDIRHYFATPSDVNLEFNHKFHSVEMLIYRSLQIKTSKVYHTYVCYERIFDGFLLTLDKTFLETTFKKSIALFHTLFLAPFEYKLVNYSSHSESLKIRINKIIL